MQALHTPAQAAQWLRQRVTGTLQSDSRKLAAGDGFIAWPGAAVDGRQFVVAALQKGAIACLVERDGLAAVGSRDRNDRRNAAYRGTEFENKTSGYAVGAKIDCLKCIRHCSSPCVSELSIPLLSSSKSASR